jgi:hypothetical protein
MAQAVLNAIGETFRRRQTGDQPQSVFAARG